jgi:hypothetical protein
MEAVGDVVYRRVFELAVVVIRLTPGGFKVNREVMLRRLRVSVKVDVTRLLSFIGNKCLYLFKVTLVKVILFIVILIPYLV